MSRAGGRGGGQGGGCDGGGDEASAGAVPSQGGWRDRWTVQSHTDSVLDLLSSQFGVLLLLLDKPGGIYLGFGSDKSRNIQLKHRKVVQTSE